jgi:type I restriction enzyme M protein
MPQNTNDIDKRLWSAADELRANSKMRSADYSAPVLGLIFLRYADAKFAQAENELTKKTLRFLNDVVVSQRLIIKHMV